MAHARRSRGRPLALAWLFAAGCGDGGCGGCGAEPQPAAAVSVKAEDREASEPAAAGDPLLAQAREGIREGELPEALRSAVIGSTAPEHARARRVLLAMEDAGADAPTEPEAAADERPRPPPILPPGSGDAVPEVAAPERPAMRDAAGSGSGSAERPARPKGRADLGGLTLRTSKRGATLTIAAPSSLVVGVANQPSSGLVRLVIESAQAGSAVLHARPRVEGAAVTSVRQGQGTVQITVTLEPGWTLGSVQPFSGGAKVHLVAPP